MCDERRIIINPENAHESEDGLAKWFAIIFWLVMIVGIVDHALTVTWKHVATWWDAAMAALPF